MRERVECYTRLLKQKMKSWSENDSERNCSVKAMGPALLEAGSRQRRRFHLSNLGPCSGNRWNHLISNTDPQSIGIHAVLYVSGWTGNDCVLPPLAGAPH